MSKEKVITSQLIKIIRKYVWKRQENECWPWTGAKIRGYGYITINTSKFNKETYRVNRVVYTIHNGTFDWELQVLHSCDVPACCNPRHLWLGTHTNNHEDCDIKNRRPKGEDHNRAKLTEEDVKKIRFKRALGVSPKEILKEFDIAYPTLKDIINYRTWKHVT